MGDIILYIGLGLLGGGVALGAWAYVEWQRYHYTPPKRKRRSNWEKPRRARHRA